MMKNNERTRALLTMHCQTYPKLEIQDIFKFLYQSAFGCEHLVSSPDRVTDYIAEEYSGICRDVPREIESLDGAYSRVPLAYLDGGLSVKTFGYLFAASAKTERTGQADLLEKLETAKEMVREGLLPFAPEDFENAVSEWEAKGYPAVRHSETFREAYKPSYRVIANEYIPLLPILAEADRRLAARAAAPDEREKVIQ